MEKELKKYYKSISKNLPVDRKRKRQILEMIRQSVENYLSEHPDADINEILENIGKPQEIAVSYIENMTTPEILRKFRTRKIVLAIVGSLAAVILLSWIILVTKATIHEIHQENGQIVVEPAVEGAEEAGGIQ